MGEKNCLSIFIQQEIHYHPSFWNHLIAVNARLIPCIPFFNIENLKHCSYLKCSYLKMGSHGNTLTVSFFRRRARLRSRAHDFHYSIEKRCGELGRYVSFDEIHAQW